MDLAKMAVNLVEKKAIRDGLKANISKTKVLSLTGYRTLSIYVYGQRHSFCYSAINICVVLFGLR